MAFLPTQPYKGTRDFYPNDMALRRWIERGMREVCESFGYREYDGPMLEPFELYAAKSGEELVNGQLYWMIDRGERKVAIRPEMTPTLARMVAGKLNELPRPIRWYSIPNLWRYERPQRGRLREFWQLNVDVLGGDPVDADVEILTLSLALLRRFGGERFVSIRVNNRRMMDDWFTREMGLPPEAALKVAKAIDARPKIGEENYARALAEAGVGPDARANLERFFAAPLAEAVRLAPGPGADELGRLFARLEASGIRTGSSAAGGDATVVYDPAILRGLDYYTGTVFEMFDVSPENRRAMFGGGRYDNLIGLFGKEKLSGVGLGLGDVTFLDFLRTHGLAPPVFRSVDVFVSSPGESTRSVGADLAEALRAAGLRVVTPLELGGFGAQLKQAVRHGARFAVLFGETEFADGKVILKDLDANAQEIVAFESVPTLVRERLRADSR